MYLDWPVRNGSKVVTTATNQQIWKAASLGNPAFAARVASCSWRKDYASVVESFVQLQLSNNNTTTATDDDGDEDTVIRMCQAGLDEAMNTFVMRNDDGSVVSSLADVLQSAKETGECSHVAEHYVGKRDLNIDVPFRIYSPHGSDVNPLLITDPADADAQLKAWEEYGCLEPSAAEQASSVCHLPCAPTSNKIFCLLGATSELGPARQLFPLPDTHILGVCRGGSRKNELVNRFMETAPSSSSLRLCCADLLSDFVSIAHWILQESRDETKQLVVCSLVYMDGEANVRATLAMDCIVQILLAKRSNVALSYLTSPATVYTIPPAAAAAAKSTHESQSWTTRWLFQSENTWTQTRNPPLYNGIVNLQGPNYCLAKTIQQWRCLVAAASGIVISAPHAPPSRTVSVTHNRTAAAALDGQTWVAPSLLPFDATVASSLMTAILLQHLQDPPKFDPRSPFSLFWEGAVHGGMWRCPFKIESVSVASYLAGRLMGRPAAAALGPPPHRPTEEAV